MYIYIYINTMQIKYINLYVYYNVNNIMGYLKISFFIIYIIIPSIENLKKNNCYKFYKKYFYIFNYVKIYNLII